ncbi:MAG: hypothetical protein SPLUMA1_SPLUMAMAG1_01254 [uncultured Sulfurimonas sp.]|nr:MAG: hypothetical protein SPLUMA1_SPLUMAMAG1_01254 [uncultured Sulfurimonas sp.]
MIKNYGKKVVATFLIGLMILAINGCSSGSLTLMQEEKLSSFSITDIQAHIDNIKKAKTVDKLDFYSYKNFFKAESLAYEAMSMNNSHADKMEVYNMVEESKKYLQAAYNSKQIIENRLNKVLLYKVKLDKLHARELFSDEYNDISENITQMMHDIDDGDGIEAFKPRDETLQMAQVLYSKIKVSSNLHDVQAILNTIDSNVSPKSYQKALEKFKNAKFTINKFPDDENMIKEVTVEAFKEAEYAQAIAKEVKKLLNLDDAFELYIINKHEKISEIQKSVDKNGTTFKTLSYNSKIATLRDLILKKMKTLDRLATLNTTLLSTEKTNQKTILELKEKLNTQLVNNKLLQNKIEILNSDLFKSKDSSLDMNSKLLLVQKNTSDLEKNLQELKTDNTKVKKNFKSTKASLETEKGIVKKLKAELLKKEDEVKTIQN